MSIGPVDLVVIKFPGNRFSGEIIPAIQRVVDNGTIRIIDILFAIRQGEDDVRVLEIGELEDDLLQRFDPVVADVTGLLTANDAKQLTAGLAPNSSVALLLFENTWARNVADAIANASGEVLLTERIPRQVIADLVAEREEALRLQATASA
jgi:hypothetical protein